MKRTLIVLGIALCFGVLHWILDGVYDYLTFRENLRALLLQEPLSIGDSILYNVPPDEVVSRTMFLLACLMGGGLTLTFLKREDEARRNLLESEARFRFLSESAWEAVVVHDHVVIIYTNRAYEDLFGFKPDGQLLNDVMPRTVIPEDLENMRTLAAQPYTPPTRLTGVRGDGSPFPMEVEGKTVQYARRRVRVAALRDISRQKEYEERLKRLSAKVMTAQEEERVRVGRELHDSTAQSLGAIKLLVSGELARIQELGCAEGSSLPRVVDSIQSALSELRHTIMNLRPTMLDDLGLCSALDWLIRETQYLHPRMGLTSKVDLDESRLDDTVKTVLFRVSQEALSNAVRHSRGTSVRLVLLGEPSGISLEVEDNGRGFSLRDVGQQSVGLESMRERVELVGGRLIIASAPGEGARIRVLIPWPDQL